MADIREASPATFAAQVQSRLMSRRAFAARARIGERKLDRLIARKVIPVVRIGTSVLVDTEGADVALATKK